MTDLQDAFPNICMHKNVKLIANQKQIEINPLYKAVKCIRCNKIFKCPHNYGDHSYKGSTYEKVCNVCGFILHIATNN